MDDQLPQREPPTRSLLEREALLIAVGGACVAVCFAATKGAFGADTWLALAAGRTVSGGLPHHDTWTTLAHGRSWVDQQWLAQLLLFETWRLGGVRLLAVLDAVCIAVTLVSLAALARRTASARSVALVLALSLVLADEALGLRTQTLAYPLFAALLWTLLGTTDLSRRRFAVALTLLAVWANLHGSVVLACLLVCVAVFGRWRGGVAVAVTAAVAWLASPYAAGLPGYYSRVLFDPSFARLVPEWQAPTLRSEPIFFIAAIVAIVGVALRRDLFSRVELVFGAGLLLMAFSARRDIVWFAFLLLVLAPRLLDAMWVPGDVYRVGPSRFLAATGIALAAAAAAFVGLQRASWFTSAYPPRAVQALAAAPSGRVFADVRYADWLLWEDPRLAGRVVFDARFELLHGDELTAVARFGEGGERPPAAAAASIFVLPRASPLAHRLSPVAQRLFGDDDLVVLALPKPAMS